MSTDQIQVGTQDKHDSQAASAFPVSCRLIFLLTLFFVSLAITPHLITLSLILLLAWALSGVKQAVQAVSLTVIIKYLNPALYEFPVETGVLIWLVMIAAAVRLLLTVSMGQLKIIAPFLMFGAVAAALSIMNSPLVGISLMKVLSFSIIAVSVVAGMENVEKETITAWEVWFFSVAVAILLLSLAVFFFPVAAYFQNGSGFQGIFNHPQALGTWFSPVLAWLVLSLFRMGRKTSGIVLTIVTVIFVLMVATKARTGMIAVIASVTLALAVKTVYSKYKADNISVSRMFMFAMAGLAFLGFGLIFSSSLYEGVKGYVLKREASNLEESFYTSRGWGIQGQWENFLDKPLTGNGFGVYPSGYIKTGLKTFLGIPISAPAEKGFLPTAILEEVGIIGTLFFLWLLFVLFSKVNEGGDLRWTGMFLACLFINVGEMVFFSVGGVGLYYWLLIGLCVAGGKHRAVAAI